MKSSKSASPPPPNPKAPTARDGASLRRKFIIDRASSSQHQEVRDDEIAREAVRLKANWGLTAQSFKDDADYFKRMNIPIVRPPRLKKFVHVAREIYPYELRKTVLPDEKMAIGQLAADLIRGASNMESGARYTAGAIFAMLAEHEKIPAHQAAAVNVMRKLKSIYAKYDRCCAVDSGTTTLRVAQVFQTIGNDMLPDPHSNLKALTLVTNSTEVANALCSPKSSLQVIMLGGRLRKETHAFAGSLAKICISAWDLNMEISMVGVVGIKRRRQFVGTTTEDEFLSLMSDTYEEAETKQALFSRSLLRVVLMDGSKFFPDNEVPAMGHFAFAHLVPEDVDLIITDAKPGLKDQYELCWKQGVAVLAVEAEPRTKKSAP